MSVKDINTTIGTWGVPEKDAESHRLDLIHFFTPREHVFKRISPEDFIFLARVYVEFRDEIEDITAFVKRHPNSIHEITENDVRAARDTIAVNTVMES